jgi:anti-sigma B factor antagonist
VVTGSVRDLGGTECYVRKGKSPSLDPFADICALWALACCSLAAVMLRLGRKDAARVVLDRHHCATLLSIQVDEAAEPEYRVLLPCPPSVQAHNPGLVTAGTRSRRYVLVADVEYVYELVDGVPVVSVAVVRAPEQIDITVADQFRSALLDATSGEHPRLVVDMTRTRFCDSAGIRSLAQAAKRIQGEGGELRLIIPPDGAVRRILSLTRIDLILPCFTSLAAALDPAPDSDHCPASP